jgi:hypothetical protein
MMETFYTIETVISAVFYGLSFLLFLFTRPWKTPPGRLLLAVLFCLATVLGLVSLSFLVGPFEGREYIRVMIYTLTMLSGIIVFLSILFGQIFGSRERKRVHEQFLRAARGTSADDKH